jgi:hypothetical protein
MTLPAPNAQQPDPRNIVYRFLLLHPKQSNPATLAQLRQAIHYVMLHATQQDTPGIQVEVVTGEEDYNRRWHACGGWDGWIATVGNDASFYSGYIVPGPDAIVGKATAGIVEVALRRGASVYFVDPATGTVLPVTAVNPTGANDYAQYARVVAGSPFADSF